MNFALILSAAPIIQMHLIISVLALVLGAYILFARKGTSNHRALGLVWMGLMVLVAASSMWIRGLADYPQAGLAAFSPIHILSLFTLASVSYAIWAARSGKLKDHKSSIVALYVSLFVAGIFTLYPGRLMGQVLLGW